MIRNSTAKLTTFNTTKIISFSKSPSIICHEFIDANGVWNKGFTCPIQNFVQYFCCHSNNYYYYCCTPDHYLSEMNSHDEQFYISGKYQPSNRVTFDQNYTNSLINNSRIINKEFELFQKLFLPIFLLSSSVLLLVGFALWFWLYRHKVFYAIERDNINKLDRTERQTSQAISNNTPNKTKKIINLTMERNLQRMSYASTEV